DPAAGAEAGDCRPLLRRLRLARLALLHRLGRDALPAHLRRRRWAAHPGRADARRHRSLPRPGGAVRRRACRASRGARRSDRRSRSRGPAGPADPRRPGVASTDRLRVSLEERVDVVATAVLGPVAQPAGMLIAEYLEGRLVHAGRIQAAWPAEQQEWLRGIVAGLRCSEPTIDASPPA